MAELELGHLLLVGLGVAVLSYLLAYLAGMGWAKAWFEHKARHQRATIMELERRARNGNDEDE